MALIYPTIWEQGNKRKQLTPGYHYKQTVKSLVVPEGQVVTFYEREDRTGWKSLPLNEGTYHHLYFYGIKDRPGVIHVEENGLTSLDLVDVGWNVSYDPKDKSKKYAMYYAVPTGDRKAGEDFPDNKIQWLRIPFGMTVEVFDSDKFSGGSLIFSGNKQDEKERVNLWDYKFKAGTASWRTSSMKVRADEWVAAGIAIEDEKITSGEMVAGTTEIFNNSEHKAECSKEISGTFDETMEENWGVEAGVTASAGFEAGTETVKATGNVEVSFSGSYGENKSTSEGRSFSDVASVELDGFGKAKISMIVEYGQIEGIAVRKWRNKRNNVIIEQRGPFKCKKGNKARIEIH